MRYDLIIRNGQVVTLEGVAELSLGVSEGRIVAIEPEISGEALEEVDASGMLVLPGVIDVHVHFNEPGRAEWEGIATGSAAVAAGGGTCFFDMPLNASPPTLDGPSFDLKRVAAERQSLTDFGLWGGIVPGNLDRLEELAERGVIGFKAFMSASGINDFLRTDDETLFESMKRAAALNLPVAVHAEDENITDKLTRQAREKGCTGARECSECRPIEAEVEAIRRAISLAEEAVCSLHIVHVSSAAGVAEVVEARTRGVDVTCETCPHYLLFSHEDFERLGAIAKCAPPLRDPVEVEKLWNCLLEGDFELVASDHSPSPVSMKAAENVFDAWGGITGCQSMLAVMLVEGHLARGLTISDIARLVSANPARRFDIQKKGRIEVGFDADLALVDVSEGQALEAGHLFYRHPISPYIGRRLHGLVRRTVLRGRTIFADGTIRQSASGRLVRPARAGIDAV